MVDKNEVVERLKAEGRLTRNTGTNSIKATNERIDITNEKLDRLSVIFAAISNFVNDQTDILRDMLDLDIKAKEEEKRRRELESVENTTLRTRDTSERDDVTDIRPTSEQKSSLWSGLFSMLGGALGGLGGALAGVTLGGIGIAALIATLAEPAAEFIADFLKAGLEDLGLNPETAEAFKEYLKTGAYWALIGRALGVVFGRRLALLFAAGGILWKALDDAFGATEAIQRMADAFDIDLSEGWAEAIGAAIGVALISILPKVIKKIIPKIFGAAGVAAGAAAATGAAGAGAGAGAGAAGGAAAGAASKVSKLSKFLKGTGVLAALGTAIDAGAGVMDTELEEKGLNSFERALTGIGEGFGDFYSMLDNATRSATNYAFGTNFRTDMDLGGDIREGAVDIFGTSEVVENANRQREYEGLTADLRSLESARSQVGPSDLPFLEEEIERVKSRIEELGFTPVPEITTNPEREITPPLPPLPRETTSTLEYPSMIDSSITDSELNSRIQDFLNRSSSDAVAAAVASRGGAVIIRGGDTNNVSISRGGSSVVNNRTSIGRGGGGGFFQGSGFMGDPFGKLPVVQ